MRRLVGETGAETVYPSENRSAEADVLAPCAMPAVHDDQTIPTLRAGIVHEANNRLTESRHAGVLEDRGTLFAPDYVMDAAPWTVRRRPHR